MVVLVYLILGKAERFLKELGAGKWLIAGLLSLAPCEPFWQAVIDLSVQAVNSLPTLKQQEIPLDHADSCNTFQPSAEKPFLATPAAIDMYTNEVIIACWQVLRHTADEHRGIDYLQVFEDDSKSENLWFIEDGPGGAITALLPSDY